MTDLRDKAIEAILDLHTDHRVSWKDAVIDVLETLPLTQPEPQWIPCSERLPDKETYVLISKKPHPLTGKKWCVTIAGRFVDGRSRKLEWRDIGFGRIVDDEILAWMPLPEPWRGDKHDMG